MNEKPATNGTEPRRLTGGLFASGSIVSGLAALIGASCCVLPIFLVQAGVSTALVAQLGIFVQARSYLMAVTVVLLILGFIAAFWGWRRPRSRVLVQLAVATLLVLSAYSFPYFEGQLMDWVRGR
jgi:mercuric ion transport protein